MARVFLLLSFIAVCQSAFNHSKCPSYWELQSDYVKTSFDVQCQIGNYYELYAHDYFQKPGCFDYGINTGPSCVTTKKSFDPSYGDYGAIYQYFCVECFGVAYCETERDVLTNITGFAYDYLLNGSLHNIPWVYPETFVAVSDTFTSEGKYEWMIELQCLDNEEGVYYIGIEYYAYTYNASQQLRNDMLNTAYQQGLGPYMNQSEFTEIPFENCTFFD